MKKQLLSSALLLSLLLPSTQASLITFAEESTSESTQVSTETNESSQIDWNSISKQIQTNLDAKTITTKYTQIEPQTFELGSEDIIATLHGYAYYEVSDIDDDLEIIFGDQTDSGGVIIYDFSIENKSNAPIFPVVSLNTKVTGDTDYVLPISDVLDDPTFNTKFVAQNQTLPAGESIRGLFPQAIKPSTMEKLNAEGFAMLEIPAVYSSEDFSGDTLLVRGNEVRIPFSIDGAQAVKEAEAFYADKYTSENWGKKTLIKEKQTNESIESDDLKITLVGYQLTQLEPNVDYASGFADFKDGIYLLTVDLNFENNSDEDMTLSSLSGILTMADMISYFNEGLLEVSKGSDAIVSKEGGTGQYYQTYLMDGATYQKFAEDEWIIEIKPQTTDFDRLGDKETFFFTIQ